MAAPAGFVIGQQETSVPEGFTVMSTPEAEEESLNFAQRFGQDIDRRVDMLGEIQRAVQEGEQSTVEGIFQVAGKLGAGTILDFIGEGLVSGARGLSNITPDIIENPVKDAATYAAHEFLNTDIAQMGLERARDSVDGWNIFKENHPRAARNIESVVNVGLLLPVAPKAKVKPTQPTGLGRAAQAVEASGTQRAATQRADFIDDLVMPKQTAAVRTEQAARSTEEGILRSRVVQPNAAERSMAAEVTQLSSVSPNKTLQGNYNAINDALGKEATRLRAILNEAPANVSRGEVRKSLELAQQRINQMPTMVGDAGRSATRLIDEANRIVKQNPATTAGLLKSRQQFDAFVRSQKPKVFDPATENAMSLAVREVRQTMNNLINVKSPTAGVRESLTRQHNMYRAMDNIAPKVADEGTNALMRGWQNLTKVMPWRGRFNNTMATLVGVGGLGAAAMFAPFFTGLAGIGGMGYLGHRMYMSPSMRKAVAMVLRDMDKAIKKAKDPEIISQLRADRATLKELGQASSNQLEVGAQSDDQTTPQQ